MTVFVQEESQSIVGYKNTTEFTNRAIDKERRVVITE